MKFSKPTYKDGEIGRFSLSTNLENQLQCTAEFISKALKIFLVLIVFIAAENMSCVNENLMCTLHII